jgi:hypothetical protein
MDGKELQAHARLLDMIADELDDTENELPEEIDDDDDDEDSEE